MELLNPIDYMMWFRGYFISLTLNEQQTALTWILDFLNTEKNKGENLEDIEILQNILKNSKDFLTAQEVMPDKSIVYSIVSLNNINCSIWIDLLNLNTNPYLLQIFDHYFQVSNQ